MSLVFEAKRRNLSGWRVAQADRRPESMRSEQRCVDAR